MKYELNFKTDEDSQAPSTYAWLLYNKCMDLLKPEQYRIEYWADELARNEGARKAAFKFFSKDAIKAKDAREQQEFYTTYWQESPTQPNINSLIGLKPFQQMASNAQLISSASKIFFKNNAFYITFVIRRNRCQLISHLNSNNHDEP